MSCRLPLCAAIRSHGRAVLVAPPGAGKTTRVPLALMDQVAGRILMLEPRRLAARAAAERLAQSLGEAVGGRVGYRMRGESVRGSRIEVVTEGILTRMIQTDPALEGVGCVIFDEFHERSLNADLGLALVWEARGALREDLAVLVMSATLDAGPVAAMLDDAPVVTSEGRAFPVETRWLGRPLPAGGRLADDAARLIARAEDETRETGGTILAFLPGEGEIRRVTAALSGTGCEVLPLYGALPAAAQRAALAPPGAVRRIVLATAIAETSLTIPGVRVVVDAGRARRARFDPGSGMSRLVTERVSRAEADQRRGRAGRVAPGICYRMWARAEEGALPAFAPPEIAVADLTGLALELAVWGAGAADLAFLTPPPDAALTEARVLRRSAALGCGAGGSRRMAGCWHGCRCIRVWRICWRWRGPLPPLWRRCCRTATRCAGRGPIWSAAAARDPRSSGACGIQVNRQGIPEDQGRGQAVAAAGCVPRRRGGRCPPRTPPGGPVGGRRGLAGLSRPDRAAAQGGRAALRAAVGRQGCGRWHRGTSRWRRDGDLVVAARSGRGWACGAHPAWPRPAGRGQICAPAPATGSCRSGPVRMVAPRGSRRRPPAGAAGRAGAVGPALARRPGRGDGRGRVGGIAPGRAALDPGRGASAGADRAGAGPWLCGGCRPAVGWRLAAALAGPGADAGGSARAGSGSEPAEAPGSAGTGQRRPGPGGAGALRHPLEPAACRSITGARTRRSSCACRSCSASPAIRRWAGGRCGSRCCRRAASRCR